MDDPRYAPSALGSAPSTIASVARRAGVSIATVSRVLNGRGKYSVATEGRVLDAVQALRYARSSAARGLAGGRTRTLALLLPDVGAEFFAPLLHGAADAAANLGYDLLLTLRPARAGQPPVGRHNADGVLVFPHSVEDGELHALRASGCQIVLLYHALSAFPELLSVRIRDAEGAGTAVRHLIGHGRRRIALLRGPPGYEDALERERGYREALAEAGLPIDEALIGEGHYSAEHAYRTVRNWCAAGLDFDALFAADDDSASGALRALSDCGVAVPAQVAVCGFDDAPFAAHLVPPLSTVRADAQRVGREAVGLLVARLEEYPGPIVHAVHLPTTFQPRRSCGCLPQD